MPHYPRRAVLGAALAAAAAPALGQPRSAGAPARPPSILFILADDLGWGDLGAYGRDDLRTPNIDRLAREGMRFTQAYAASSVCSPTRVALATGQWPGRHRAGLDEPLGRDPSMGLPPTTPALPRLLAQAGWRTGLIGKWHLGVMPPFSPLAHGYQSFWGIKSGGVGYFTHRNMLPHMDMADLWDGDTPVEATGYLTTLLAERAETWLAQTGADPRPFLLSLHFTAPHWPWETEADADKAAQIKSIFHAEGGSIATYRAMVEALDAAVGRAAAALERAGRANDTIVVFTSDNGGERFSKSWPLTGMKGELLEGGIRVPLIVRWPGRVRAGSESPAVVSTIDWLPTFAEIAGVALPARPDGVSFLPALDGRPLPERPLFWRHNAHGQGAVRMGRWKWLRLAEREFLFDVEADPQERANRAEAEPTTASDLRARWEAWAATLLPYPPGIWSVDVKRPGNLADRY
jgi:arylsulfatase A-like enzyme